MAHIKISIITSLYRGERYLKFFLQHLARITNPSECELILIHNDPSEVEIKILSEFNNPGIAINYLQVKRESLYSSWNRAAVVARGEYLTIWNVDDVRLPAAIENQANALDDNREAAVAYGDFVIVREYGSNSGIEIHSPNYAAKDRSFLRQHHIGPFPMWRKEIHKVIGYFDEQFNLIADFDFQVRAAREFKFIKVNENLGYFLEGTSHNLSSNYKQHDYEHTAMHLRYGNLDLIYITYLYEVRKSFRVNKYKWCGEFHPVEKWYRLKESKLLKILPMITVPFLKLPRHVVRKYFREAMRKYFKYHILGAKIRLLLHRTG